MTTMINWIIDIFGIFFDILPVFVIFGIGLVLFYVIVDWIYDNRM